MDKCVALLGPMLYLQHCWPSCVEQLAARRHYIDVTRLFQAATEKAAV